MLKNSFSNFIFSLQKPKAVFVAGKNREMIVKIISGILALHPEMKKNTRLMETDLSDIGKINSFARNSSLPILVASDFGEISDRIRNIAKIFPKKGYLILSNDNKDAREIGNNSSAKSITFGLGEGADFNISDITSNGNVNFKINYKGSIVPVWMNGPFTPEKANAVLAAAASACALNLNLVEISQALKNQSA